MTALIKLQVLFHLILGEHGNPDTMRYWLQDDIPSLIPIIGGICIFYDDVPNKSLCSITDNSQSTQHWQANMFFNKVCFSRQATKWAYLQVSKFDFCHIVSVPPRGVEFNNCPRGTKPWRNWLKFCMCTFWVTKHSWKIEHLATIKSALWNTLNWTAMIYNYVCRRIACQLLHMQF